MSDLPLDADAVLGQLKDFQRETVEYVFRRMYLDDDRTRRFLVADEVGLGKTLVARGLIAKTVAHLWDKTDRIDVVYVCSNAEIARQNIARLNVTGHEDFVLSSRITLLPVTVGGMRHRRVNFVSFTPGTSFDLKDSGGRSDERELLYWLLKDVWPAPFAKATRVLEGYATTDAFRDRVERFPQRRTIHPDIAAQFAERLGREPELRREYERLCEEVPRAGVAVPPAFARDRNRLVGELRKALAQTCLGWLEPDLIVLDEFQRFKHLLEGGSDEASESAQLAEHLFSYEAAQGDEAAAARVLLLSATPYKMFTLAREQERDDHYADFEKTLRFLVPGEAERARFHARLADYREQLLRAADAGPAGFLAAKAELEEGLRRVMVRTERLAVTADRNGMLADVPCEGVALTTADVRQYLSLRAVAGSLGHDDVLEYWKSAPYLLNFMEDYDLKRKLKAAADAGGRDPELVRAVRGTRDGLLDRREIEAYGKVDPANARLRGLHADLIGRGAWRLLWVPPSLPYYRGGGPFADPRLEGFTKRLVFSCWKVVPKAVAAVLSYEAERRMTRAFRRKVANTAEARKTRKPLLRFTFGRDRRPNGLPALALVYPCRTLAKEVDPLTLANAAGELPSLEAAAAEAGRVAAELLVPVVKEFADPAGPPDERWYWAAPLLIDRVHDAEATRAWFDRPALAREWSGEAAASGRGSAGWAGHVRLARRAVRGEFRLGTPPEDLAAVVGLLALAGPGVAALRALTWVVPGGDGRPDLRTYAAPVAHGFLHLFNLPEVMSLVRDRSKALPYWRSVLDYCAAGNLQAVLDEYAHLLAEAAAFKSRRPEDVAAGVRDGLLPVLGLRTTTAQADLFSAGRGRVRFEEPLRMRTRFAMRFGDQKAEDTGEDTRADHVRAAFNSPFWPFVLATTSVGQEGLDFHPYCHAVVHWNLPSNPVDLEQREGRVHRYKGHALRKNVAARFRTGAGGAADPWDGMFMAAKAAQPAGECDLAPYWVCEGTAKIERHVPALPHSREVERKATLRRSLVLYRMAFGQNRQEDLVDYLLARLSPQEAERLAEQCRVDLSPRRMTDAVGEESAEDAAPAEASPSPTVVALADAFSAAAP